MKIRFMTALLCLAYFLTAPLGHANEALATKSALDLAGKAVDPLDNITNRAVVLIFVASECPISNGYAPELKRLNEKFAPKEVKFWLVYPNADDTAGVIRRHAREYQLQLEALRDPHHALVKRSKATVTPEAAVFIARGRMVYHGRLDDRHIALGKQRPEATQHDLEEVLQAIVDGKKPPTSFRKPVGCYIQEH